MFSASDFPYLFREELIDRFSIPQIWQERSVEGLGEYTLSILWNWPVDFLYGLLGRLGVSFPVIQILLFFIPFIVIGIIGIKKILSYYKIVGWPSLVATFFYILNTYTILLIDGGQFSIALAYVTMPMAFYFLIRSLENKKGKYIVYSGLTVSLLGIFDIRFVYILFLLMIIEFLFWKYSLLILVKVGFWTAVIFIGINFYWILPAILSQAPLLPETYSRSSQISFLSFATLGHATLALQPHWPRNVFGQVSPILSYYIFIPVLAFSAAIFSKKSKVVSFWLVVALISIFLIKGSQYPFGEIYTWIFTSVPGFSLFRDSSKFFVLLNLSFAILIGFTSKWLYKKNKYSVLVLLIYFLVLINPVWLGKMTGSLGFPNNQNQFFSLANKIENISNFGRIIWLPSRPPLGISSAVHPSLETNRLLNRRPFAIGVVGTYETLNFLREAPFIDQILNISGVGYVAYPFPDQRREDLSQEQIDYYNNFLVQLKNSHWSDKSISEFPVHVLQTKSHQDRFFITNNTYYIVGSDRIYWDLAKLENFDLSKIAFIFVEEQPETLASFNNVNSKLILYDKYPLDLQLSQLNSKEFIFPAKNLDFSPNKTNWWKRETPDLVWWKDFLEQKYGIYNLDFDYGGGWAISEGENTLIINSNSILAGEKLFIRAMESSRGGNIDVYQNQQLIGNINTKLNNPEKVEVKLTGNQDASDQIFEYDKSNVRWFEVGDLIRDSEITIQTNGDINVVNALVSVNKNNFSSLPEHFSFDNVNFNTQGNQIVNYTRISPTHYKINVNGLTHPSILAFSQSYSHMWELEGQKPVKLYSLINGFTIDRNGEYDLYFSPQKYVFPGLIISLITLIISIILLRWKSKDIV